MVPKGMAGWNKDTAKLLTLGNSSDNTGSLSQGQQVKGMAISYLFIFLILVDCGFFYFIPLFDTLLNTT